MILEKQLVERLIREKRSDGPICVVVPRKYVFSSRYLHNLVIEHNIWVVNAGLVGEDDIDCYRVRGIDFNWVYLFKVQQWCTCVKYIKSRFKPNKNWPGEVVVIE